MKEPTVNLFIYVLKKDLGSTGVTGILFKKLKGKSPAPTIEKLITNDDGTETKESTN